MRAVRVWYRIISTVRRGGCFYGVLILITIDGPHIPPGRRFEDFHEVSDLELGCVGLCVGVGGRSEVILCFCLFSVSGETSKWVVVCF